MIPRKKRKKKAYFFPSVKWWNATSKNNTAKIIAA